MSDGYRYLGLAGTLWHVKDGSLITPTTGRPYWLHDMIQKAIRKQDTPAIDSDRKVRMPWLVRQWVDAERLDFTDKSVVTHTNELWTDFMKFCNSSPFTEAIFGDLETKGRSFFTQVLNNMEEFGIDKNHKHGSVAKGVKIK